MNCEKGETMYVLTIENKYGMIYRGIFRSKESVLVYILKDMANEIMSGNANGIPQLNLDTVQCECGDNTYTIDEATFHG